MAERLVGVAVTGTGKVSVAPDLAVVRFTAGAEGASAASALERAVETVEAMVAVLVEAGVAETDRRTAGMHLSSWREEPGRPLRHQAGQQLTVRLRDITAAGGVVERVLGAGGDHAGMHSFTLIVDDREPHLVQARQLAVADARAKAEQLATLAGRPLGAVLAIAEHNGDRHDSAGGEAFMMDMARSAAMPVESGELDVEVRLSVELAWGD